MASNDDKPGSPDVHRDTQSAQVLHVSLERLELHETRNFFCTVALNEGMIPGGGAKQRTEVSNATNKPVFSSSAFQFPSTVEWQENGAELTVSVLELVHAPKTDGGKKKGSAKPYGSCVMNLAQHQNALTAGEEVGSKMDILTDTDQKKCGDIQLRLQLKAIDGPEMLHRGSRANTAQVPQGRARVISPFENKLKQYVSLQVRSAFNLPLAHEGEPPSSYVAVKTKEQEEKNISGAQKTKTVSNTRNPVWNETVILECENLQPIVVAVVNGSSSSLLRKVEIPLDKLTVAQVYNLELALPPGDARLYVQVCLHSLAEPPPFLKQNAEMLRLEVDLGGLANKLLVPSDEVVAVVQLVSNEESYVSWVTRTVRNKGQIPQLPLRTIKSGNSWETLGQTLAGSRQASSATNGKGVAPEWNELFAFTQQRKDVATEHAALAIELFQRNRNISAVEEIESGADRMKFIGFATQRIKPLFDDPRILNEGETKNFENVRVYMLGLPPSAISFRASLQQASVFITAQSKLAAGLNVLPTDGADESERRSMLRNLCRLDLPLPAAIRATTAPLPPGVDNTLVHSSTFQHRSSVDAPMSHRGDYPYTDTEHSLYAGDNDVASLRRQLQERDMNIAVYRSQIADMREREAGLLEEVNRVRQQAEQARSVPISVGQLDDLDRDELERRFSVLLRNYQTERRENEKLAKWLKQLRHEMKSNQQAASEHQELQEAHLEQAEVMKKLREENQHLVKCKDAMKDQELVILKLEDLLDAAVRKQQEREAEMQLVAPDLQLKLEQANQVIQQLQEDLGNALAAGPADPVNPSSTELKQLEAEAYKWRLKAEMLETRVQEVEAVLESVPRQWGSDMAKLQIQLKEKDAQLAGGFGSLMNLKMGVGMSSTTPKPPSQHSGQQGAGAERASAEWFVPNGATGSRRGSRDSRRGSNQSGSGARSELEPIRGGSAGQRANPVNSAAWDGAKPERGGSGPKAESSLSNKSGAKPEGTNATVKMSAAEISSAYASKQKSSSSPPRAAPELEQHAPTPPGSGKARDPSANGRPSSRRGSSQGAQTTQAGSGRGASSGEIKHVDKDKPWFMDAGPSAASN